MRGPQALWFMREASMTLDRREQRAATDVWLQSNLGYPDYSLNTFHYQVAPPPPVQPSPSPLPLPIPSVQMRGSWA